MSALPMCIRKHQFTSGEDLEQTLIRYVALYNHQLPQSALKSKTPMRAMKDWYASQPHLFVKWPYYHPRCDCYIIDRLTLVNNLLESLRIELGCVFRPLHFKFSISAGYLRCILI
jgi:hypothetical protein